MELIKNISLLLILAAAVVYCKPASNAIEDDDIDELKESLDRLSNDVEQFKDSVEKKETSSKTENKKKDDTSGPTLEEVLAKAEADYPIPADPSEEDIKADAKEAKKEAKMQNEQFDDSFYQPYDVEEEIGEDFDEKLDAPATEKQDEIPAALDDGKHLDKPIQYQEIKDEDLKMYSPSNDVDELDNNDDMPAPPDPEKDMIHPLKIVNAIKSDISLVMKDFMKMKKQLDNEVVDAKNADKLEAVKMDLRDAMGDFVMLDAHIRKKFGKNIAKRENHFSLTNDEISQIISDMKEMLQDASSKIKSIKAARDAAKKQKKQKKDSKPAPINAHQGPTSELVKDLPSSSKKELKDVKAELEIISKELADIKQGILDNKVPRKADSPAHQTTTEEKSMKGFY